MTADLPKPLPTAPAITRDQVQLRPLGLGGTKGGKEIWVAGELWAHAMPKWQGPHGLSHSLRYPSGSAIRAICKVHRGGKLVDSDRDAVVHIRSFKSRRRTDHRPDQVEDQPAAIISKFLECCAAGNVKSPAQRAHENAASKSAMEIQSLQRYREKDQITLGLIAMRFRPDLTELELAALKFLYKEAFINPMPTRSELLRLLNDMARAQYNSFEPDNQSQRYKEIIELSKACAP